MLKLITPPTDYPLSLDEVKAHLRVDGTDEDSYLTILIGAATEYVQNYTNRQLMPATYELTVDSLSATIPLSYPPFVGITSVTAMDSGGLEVVLDAETYTTASHYDPAILTGVAGSDWFNSDYGVTKIQYVAGYADAASVPASIKSAMLLIIGHLYTNREEVIVGTINGVSKFASDALLTPYRIFYF